MSIMEKTTKDMLILVDPGDNVLGYEEKMACHVGEGILHRAFSIFVFNSRKELLLQRRADEKPLWPGFWSNSVCSHPRKGESVVEAADRRIVEEIGISAPLTYLFKFQYQARFRDVGSENELCSVFYGFSDDPVTADPAEISEYRYVSVDALNRDLEVNQGMYTPWFKIEWQRIREEFLGAIL
jgi:isopentenyl-diphosphate delta-isomerase